MIFHVFSLAKLSDKKSKNNIYFNFTCANAIALSKYMKFKGFSINAHYVKRVVRIFLYVYFPFGFYINFIA